MEPLKKLLDLLDEGHKVSTDTRSIIKGDLFFALKGDRFNGNKYAVQAIENGAALAVVDEDIPNAGEKILKVDNALETLQDLATTHRLRYDIPVIGITGSNGKTTTKELLHQVLSQAFNVCTTKGNFNNHIGVPLTLLRIQAQHDVAIVEMGASFPDEIAFLCKIARPTAGLITNVGKAHLEGFGSEKVVFRTKMGLYDFLSANNGTIFTPEAIVSHLLYSSKEFKDQKLFNNRKMSGKHVKSVELLEVFPLVSLRIIDNNGKITDVNSQLFGSYNFDNLVNVIKIADYFGLTPQQCKDGIEAYLPDNNRSQLKQDEFGNTIILDAYNANPSSVAEALNHFLQLQTEKEKVVVLGDMLELGSISKKEHREVIERLTGYEDIISVLVGELFEEASKDFTLSNLSHLRFFQNSDEAGKWIKEQRMKERFILVKGSRGIALESIFK